MTPAAGGAGRTPASRVAIAVGIAVVVGLLALLTSCGTVPQSEVGFQVGGGPLDPGRHKVKSDLLKPGRHILGPLDKVWTFPAQRTLRFQDFEVTVTTLDGKKAELEGQVGFRFVGEGDPPLARRFAEGIGSRKYGGERAGESDKGWTNMLNQLFTPEIRATLKEQFGRVYCADFEPACRAIDPRAEIPEADPERVYGNVSTLLQQRTDRKLGAAYLQKISVRVNRITLPAEVQTNIDRVTAEQAKTKSAEQSELTAKAEAKAIRAKAAALSANPALVAIEVAKACEGGDRCTVIVDGSGRGAPPVVNAGR